MTEHKTKWLQAYYDGELGGERLRKVEAHLEDCPECQAELEKLQALSTLLQESPIPELKSAEQFAAEVALQLPRREEKTAWEKSLRIGWKLVPVVLLSVLLFLQTTWITGGLFVIVQRLGLWEDTFSGLTVQPLGGEYSGIIRAVLCSLTGVCPVGGFIPMSLILLSLIGLLYLSWLASWFARQRHHQYSNRSIRN